MDGTVAELIKAIKDHLAENPTRELEPQFNGLFGSSRKRASAMTAGLSPLSESLVDLRLTVPALPQLSLMDNTLIPDLQTYQASDIPSSSGSMSYIHAPYYTYQP
jgi:hypothetical protein